MSYFLLELNFFYHIGPRCEGITINCFYLSFVLFYDFKGKKI